MRDFAKKGDVVYLEQLRFEVLRTNKTGERIQYVLVSIESDQKVIEAWKESRVANMLQ